MKTGDAPASGRHAYGKKGMTVAQRGNCQDMAEVSRGWDELEEWERDEWRKRARQLRIRVRRQVAYANQQKARTRALRPQEFYVKINRVLGVCGYERRRLPPPEPKFGPNPLKPELEASLLKGRLVLKLVLRAAPVNDIMVFGSPPRRAGQEPGGNYAFLGLLPPPKGRKSNISEMYCRGANKAGQVCAVKSGITRPEGGFWLCSPESGTKIEMLQRRIGLCGDATRAPSGVL